MRHPADPVNDRPEPPSGDGAALPSAAARLADLFADFDSGLATGLAGAADVAPVQADAAPAKAVPLAAALAVDAAEPPATEAAALEDRKASCRERV